MATPSSSQPRSSLQAQTAPLPLCQASGLATRPSSRLETTRWSPPVEDPMTTISPPAWSWMRAPACGRRTGSGRCRRREGGTQQRHLTSSSSSSEEEDHHQHHHHQRQNSSAPAAAAGNKVQRFQLRCTGALVLWRSLERASSPSTRGRSGNLTPALPVPRAARAGGRRAGGPRWRHSGGTGLGVSSWETRSSLLVEGLMVEPPFRRLRSWNSPAGQSPREETWSHQGAAST